MELRQPGPRRFIDLSDVPHSYTGAAGEVATVNPGETGLEFEPGGGGATSPALPFTSVQYNNSGVFGGADWNYTLPTFNSEETVYFQPSDKDQGRPVFLNGGNSNDEVAQFGGPLWLRSGGVVTGPVLTVEFSDFGSGYVEGDILTLVGGGNDATIEIGGEGSLTILTNGTNYSSGSIVNVTGGSGTGATILITTQGSVGSYVYISHLDDIDLFGANSYSELHNGCGIVGHSGNGFGASTGGTINFQSGDGGDTGNGGPVIFTSGAGGLTSGPGGDVSIIAGSARAGGSNGGNIVLTPGLQDTSGNVGKFKIGDPSTFLKATLDTSLITGSDHLYKFPDLSGTFVLQESFIDNEIVSGSGTSFTLANTPFLNSEHLFGSGTRLTAGVDYSIAGTAITILLGSYSTGALVADYRI